MESIGFQVKIADNGEQGMQLFLSWHPHFIWMDRRMPVMDGLETTRRIRKLPAGEAVKIIAVTASAFNEQRIEMLDAGMDDFVRKPYRFNEIYDCLSKHLGVRFVYKSNLESEKPVMPLTSDMLTVVPESLRNELKDALESLDMERIDALMERLAPYGLQLQKMLIHLAENYEYQTILNALQEI